MISAPAPLDLGPSWARAQLAVVNPALQTVETHILKTKPFLINLLLYLFAKFWSQMLENVIYTNTYMYFKTVISQKILEGPYMHSTSAHLLCF